MSTVKVINVQHPSASSANIVLDSSGNATMAGSMAMATPFAMRNKIINGAMEIDQRNAGASVTLTSSGVYTVDRWAGYEDTDGTMTAQQSTTAPAGFINSLVCTTGTADTSLSATQYCMLVQPIEGLNITDLGWGTANAKTITLSFWVRSSLTGTFGGALRNNAQDRSYPFTYVINSANTFEYKTVTITGDTSGTWLTTNGVGVFVQFGLGVGSTLSGTAGAWAAGNYLSATGAVSVIGTAGATWYITGVQFEVGTVATPFERRLYTVELALCQRYYFTTVSPLTSSSSVGTVAGSAYSTSGMVIRVNAPVPMRASATARIYNNGTANQVRRTDNGATAAVTVSGYSVWGNMGYAYVYFSGTPLGGAGVSYDFDYDLAIEL